MEKMNKLEMLLEDNFMINLEDLMVISNEILLDYQNALANIYGDNEDAITKVCEETIHHFHLIEKEEGRVTWNEEKTKAKLLFDDRLSSFEELELELKKDKIIIKSYK